MQYPKVLPGSITVAYDPATPLSPFTETEFCKALRLHSDEPAKACALEFELVRIVTDEEVETEHDTGYGVMVDNGWSEPTADYLKARVTEQGAMWDQRLGEIIARSGEIPESWLLNIRIILPATTYRADYRIGETKPGRPFDPIEWEWYEDTFKELVPALCYNRRTKTWVIELIDMERHQISMIDYVLRANPAPSSEAR